MAVWMRMVMAISAAIIMVGGVAFSGEAATIAIWNLRNVDVAVAIDGIVQCIVQPRHACVVDDVPVGTHVVSAGITRKYEEGVGKVSPATPIELRWPTSGYKLCVFSTGLIPDECVAWVKDKVGLVPNGADVAHVAYRR